MKKILYLSANGYIGGAERFVLNICKLHIQNKKYETCILFFNNGEAVDEAILNGIPHYVLTNKFKLSSPYRLFKAALEIRGFVKKMNPDWVHTTMPYTQIVYGLSSLNLKPKIAWFQHGPVGGFLDKLASLFPSHLVFFNSEFSKKAHLSSVPISRCINLAVIRLGVESAETKREIFNQPEIRIGSSGRICSWKGFHLIIEALKIFKNTYPNTPFQFFLAGSAKTERDIEYENILKKLVTDSNLSGEIKIIGHVKEITQFYNSIDVFIHASTIPEPFGLVVAEAMGQGCFVIGSNQGGVTDIIHDKETGLSFCSTDSDSGMQLYSLVEILIKSFEKMTLSDYVRMQENGYQMIRNQYSLKSMLNEVEMYYDKIK